MPTIAFKTLGCKVNHYESEALQELFVSEGFTIHDFNDFSDIYVINTCTVTNQSDSKSRKMIRQAVRKNPDAIVAVIGCYAQVDSDSIAAIDGVDIIMGTTDRGKLLEHIRRFMRERAPIKEVRDLTRYKTFDRLNVTAFSEQTRAFLKIQDGCNEFCSYCIIPFARGRIRSRPMDEVLREAKRLIGEGYKEIVLTGIHTGGYGSDLEDVTFYDLLNGLKDLNGLKRLRISSVEINQLTRPILTLMRDYPVFAHHLHIPLQHGSDRILSTMRRRYTTKAYLDKLAEIRDILGSDIAITTDIMTGYPGETDGDVTAMHETIKAAQFSELHVFPYSKRSGTKAAQSNEQIHGTIKSMRVNDLLRLNETLAENYRQRVLTNETPLEVLVETCDSVTCKGHASNYVTVEFPRENARVNQILSVILNNASYPVSKGSRTLSTRDATNE